LTSYTRWTDTKIHTNSVERITEIFNHRWDPFVGGKGQSVTLGPANHEWPFELVIPGSTAESVEGISEASVVYNLKATVARSRLAYDLHAYKPVRIIRTLDPTALEFAHAMTIENIWPNKIEYSLVIPQKAIVLGTVINIEMKFTSLLKGLKIGPIRCQLVEVQEFILSQASSLLRRKQTREIESWLFELNEEEHYQDVINDLGQDGFVLNEILPLPKSLKKCLQDVETMGIRVRHRVTFNIALHNPDGHTSEVS
jgi:arrestin-related trafficking adapter 4/5/7